MSRAFLVLATVLTASGAAGVPRARAQDAQAQAEARTHFDRGVTLYDEGHMDAALAEFERSYELSRSYRVLYNIARVRAAQNQIVAAVDTYDRYVSEGGARIEASRRREVEAELARLRPRIGFVEVRVNAEHASVSVDGVDVAQTPMAQPLRVGAGAHVVGVHAAGYGSTERRVEVAGGQTFRLAIRLERNEASRGSVRFASALRDVEVRIDGAAIGRTPIDRTVVVAPGHHVVTASRSGYVEQRLEIDVAEGSEQRVRLTLERDESASGAELASVQVRIPPGVPFQVFVDRARVEAHGRSVELPAGTHDLEVDVAEREPYRSRIDLRAGQRLTLRPELEWDPDARASRLEGASTQRTIGVWTAVGGGAATVAALVLYLWNTPRRDEAAENKAAWEQCRMTGMICDISRRDAYEDNIGSIQLIDITAIVLAIAGLAAAGVGLTIAFLAPSDEEIDAGASAAHAHGPRLRWTF